jgi:hypothetical protein
MRTLLLSSALLATACVLPDPPRSDRPRVPTAAVVTARAPSPERHSAASEALDYSTGAGHPRAACR